MGQQSVETEVMAQKEFGTLETALRNLWDKARKTSELIISLREDNRALQRRISELETQLAQLQSEIVQKEQEIKKLQSDVSAASSNGNIILTRQEKEELKSKLKELITKINSHL